MDIFSTEFFSTIVAWYLVGGLVFCLVSAIVAGFTGTMMKKADYYDGILWPFSVSSLLGVGVRVCVERVKDRTVHKGRKNI
jgi:hypothetical protein